MPGELEGGLLRRGLKWGEQPFLGKPSVRTSRKGEVGEAMFPWKPIGVEGEAILKPASGKRASPQAGRPAVVRITQDPTRRQK